MLHLIYFFYIGLILRFTHAADSDQLSVAKIILAYDLEIWFIRNYHQWALQLT